MSWGRNVSGAKFPGANCWGRNVTEAKQPGGKMSPGRKTGGETSGSPNARHTSPQHGVMAWDTFSFDRLTPLVVNSCTLTAEQYVDDILPPAVSSLLLRHSGLNFQHDNARQHTELVVKKYLQAFLALPWSVRLSDLSPMQHIWNVMRRRL